MFNFSDDKRLMQEAPARGSAGDTYSINKKRIQEQYKLITGNTAEAVAKRDELKRQEAELDRKERIRQKNLESTGQVQDTATGALKQQVQDSQAVARDAAGASVRVEEKQRGADVDLRLGMGNMINQSKMIVPNAIMAGIGGIKTIEMYVCAIYTACTGKELDTSKFDAWLDKQEAKIKFPGADTSVLDGAKTNVSGNQAVSDYNKTTDGIVAGVAPKMRDQIGRTSGDLLNDTGGGNTTAPQKDLPTKADIAARTNDLVKDGTIGDTATGKKIVAAWAAAAKSGGNLGAVDTAQEQRLVSNVVDNLLDRAVAATVKEKLGLPASAPTQTATAPSPNAVMGG